LLAHSRTERRFKSQMSSSPSNRSASSVFIPGGKYADRQRLPSFILNHPAVYGLAGSWPSGVLFGPGRSIQNVMRSTLSRRCRRRMHSFSRSYRSTAGIKSRSGIPIRQSLQKSAVALPHLRRLKPSRSCLPQLHAAHARILTFHAQRHDESVHALSHRRWCHPRKDSVIGLFLRRACEVMHLLYQAL